MLRRGSAVCIGRGIPRAVVVLLVSTDRGGAFFMVSQHGGGDRLGDRDTATWRSRVRSPTQNLFDAVRMCISVFSPLCPCPAIHGGMVTSQQINDDVLEGSFIEDGGFEAFCGSV